MNKVVANADEAIRDCRTAPYHVGGSPLRQPGDLIRPSTARA